MRQRFLGAILLIAADEDDVLALAGSVAAFVNDPGNLGSRRCRRQNKQGGKQAAQSQHRGHVGFLSFSVRKSGERLLLL